MLYTAWESLQGTLIFILCICQCQCFERKFYIILFFFFSIWITSKEIDISLIAQKKRECIELLCLMEKELPTSFFDIQVHLLIHLVDEIEIAGVVSTC